MLVLVGPIKRGGRYATGAYKVADVPMYVAQHWALTFYGKQRSRNAHIHLLGYDAPVGAVNNASEPDTPTHTRHTAEEIVAKHHVDEQGDTVIDETKELAATDWSWETSTRNPLTTTIPSCCCFFAEVMVIFHGGQPGGYTFLTNAFRKVLAGRPVERLVLWCCESSKQFSPSGDMSDHYTKLAWLVRP